MEGLEDFKDLKGNNVNDFINEYRDAMKQSYDFNVSAINQQKRNDFASIMSQANKRGMMYSNFPERQKIQYEADTYLPNLKTAYTSYQTGLDKLRSSALSAYNNAKETEAQIAHLKQLGNISDQASKKSGASPLSSNKSLWGKYDQANGLYYDSNGKPVRFSTWVRNNADEIKDDTYLEAVRSMFGQDSDEYDNLKRIYDAQQNTKTPKLIYNANGFGNTFVDQNTLGNRYSQEDADLLNRLGLAFGN